MKIFEAEKDIAKQIESDAKSSLEGTLKEGIVAVTDESVNSNKIAESIDALDVNASIGDHPDLKYGSAILVSTVMNKNDDTFLPEETWNARGTTINTPFNDQHEETDIIGHIFDYRVIDNEGNIVSECPDSFDIEVDFVLYQSIFADLIAGIVEKAEDGEAFVSMECKITDFDYALIDEEDNMQVVARNDQTAFLTKRLRRYGGSGVYNNCRVGRVLRGIRFVGMGNVDKPANPDSHYTRLDTVNIAKVESDTLIPEYLILSNDKGKTMKIENLEQAQAYIETLEKAKTDLEASQTQAQIDELNTQITEAKTAITDLESQLQSEQEKTEASEASLTETKEQLEASKTELDKVQKEFDELRAVETERETQAVATQRLATLVELGYKVEDEEKELADLKEMSEEHFEKIRQYIAKLQPVEKEEKEEVETKTEETEEAADAEDLEEAEEVDESNIEETPEDEEPAKSGAKVAAGILFKGRED